MKIVCLLAHKSYLNDKSDQTRFCTFYTFFSTINQLVFMQRILSQISNQYAHNSSTSLINIYPTERQKKVWTEKGTVYNSSGTRENKKKQFAILIGPSFFSAAN